MRAACSCSPLCLTPAHPAPLPCSLQIVCDPPKIVLIRTPGGCTHKYHSASTWTGKVRGAGGGLWVSAFVGPCIVGACVVSGGPTRLGGRSSCGCCMGSGSRHAASCMCCALVQWLPLACLLSCPPPPARPPARPAGFSPTRPPVSGPHRRSARSAARLASPRRSPTAAAPTSCPWPPSASTGTPPPPLLKLKRHSRSRRSPALPALPLSPWIHPL